MRDFNVDKNFLKEPQLDTNNSIQSGALHSAMPRQSKKTNTADAAGMAGATTSATAKGTSSRKKPKKSSSDVSELLQTLNSNRNTTSGQDVYQISSTDEGGRQTAKRGRMTNASKGGRTEGRGGGKGNQPQRARPQTAIRGGRGRGRKGAAVRADDEVTADAQTDKGKSRRADRGRGTKLRQKEAPTGQTSSSKRRHSSGRRERFDDDDFRERQLSAQSVAKWQPTTKTSQEFLHQITENAISIVLNEASSSSYSDVQDHLNNLKRRLMTSFASLKVPAKRQPNYKDMEQHTRILEAALVETSNQVECLDKEVQLQQQLLEQKEEELEKLEAAEISSAENRQEITKKLHPLLQDEKQDILGLPSLRTSHTASTKKFEDIGSSCQQEVLDSLRHWSQSQREGEAKMTEFMDAVSTLHAALPR